jgi:hypothetical protein
VPKIGRMPFRRTLLVAALVGGPTVAALLAADGNSAADAAAAAGSYATDFSKMPAGKPTGEELFVLNGAFAVVNAGGGDKALELPGNPLDTFGVLFGPEGQRATEVTARIHGTSVGRLFPEFGVGAGDSGGWKLWVLPGQNAVVLRKKEDEVARATFAWASGTRTHLRLRVAPAADGKWAVDGKAWLAGGKEPAAWTVSTTWAATTAEPAPPAGRASVWGQPYAGTPIRFDDLSVSPAK